MAPINDLSREVEGGKLKDKELLRGEGRSFYSTLF